MRGGSQSRGREPADTDAADATRGVVVPECMPPGLRPVLRPARRREVEYECRMQK